MRDSAGKFCGNLSKRKKAPEGKSQTERWGATATEQRARSLWRPSRRWRGWKRGFSRGIYFVAAIRRLSAAHKAALLWSARRRFLFALFVKFFLFFSVTAKWSSKSYISEYIMSSDNIIRGKKNIKTFYVHWGGFSSSSDHLFISFMWKKYSCGCVRAWFQTKQWTYRQPCAHSI